MTGEIPKRGRAKLAPGERTRGSLTIRLRDVVRDEVEAAAQQAGRSLSEEIEFRLEMERELRRLLDAALANRCGWTP